MIEKIPSFTWLEAVDVKMDQEIMFKFIKDFGKQFMLQDFVEAEGP